MSSNETCRRFAEELSAGGRRSEACRAHLETCTDCRQLSETVQALKVEPSAYNRAAIEPFRRNVLRRLESSPLFTQKPTGESVFDRLIELIMPLRWTLGFAVALIILAVVSISPESPSVVPANAFRIEGEVAAVTPFTAPGAVFDLAQGRAFLHGPDGSSLEVTGPVRLIPQERGFTLLTGQVLARVKPGETPYVGRTPHGTIEVLGTVFECTITEHATTVRVVSGTVKVVPNAGEPTTLEADQSTTMNLQEGSEVDNASTTYPPITDLQGE